MIVLIIPLSLYAASKNQMNLWHILIAIFTNYQQLAKIFTVYGPWGRPDMALFKFTKNILEEKTIEVFNNGKHTREILHILMILLKEL